MLQSKVNVWWVVLALWVGVFASSYLSLSQFKQQLIHEKEQYLQAQTDQIVSLVRYLQHQVDQGQLTKAQAQQQAADVVRVLRYGKDGYFWVNDIAHQLVVHPYRLKQEGTSMYDFQDKEGAYVYREFVTVAASPQGSGFLRYYRAKPGFENSQAQFLKLSYVKRVDPWGWVIGTGIYLDDVEQLYQVQLNQQITLWVALFAATFLLVMMLFMRRESREGDSAA